MIKEFRIGDVLGSAFSILFRNIVPFCLITGLILLPQIAYSLYVAFGIQTMSVAKMLETLRWYALITIVLSLLLTPVATGAVTFGVFQQLRGKHASVGECLSVGISRMFPVIGVAILAGLMVLGGAILLIIPGLIVLTMVYVAVPVAVVEKPGVGASIRRSFDLTKGNRWLVFGILFILWLMRFVVNWLLQTGLIRRGSISTFSTYTIVSLVVTVIFSALEATTVCVAYYHLRSTKEAIDADQIASVFD